ncbi:Serine/threonine-protein kinase PrkC [Planctomycetes bacterium K23_9]|uniref:non-specific serine/threonine protein kinase n=1 Tax=Stieleria marina TaxID=1930275 RepID=A0A517NND3_9BACT|nr:Serine/threonine-protein kinase PrkC [Planctomycetes bacterium K23_9]
MVDEASIAQLLGPTDTPDMMGWFGGYEISGIIGSGGMGIVMKGLDVSLNRFVAIKVLNPAMGCTSAERKRFARETQAAAAVVHENVISIHGVDEWNGTPYLVMPYVKGESLQQRIDRTAPLSLENTLEIGLQIARGLAAAHDQGLVHRDIKPANILMSESISRILITDFGLARAADDVSLTNSGVISGTPQYISPEQAKSEAVDTFTDLFSLGSVMYAMQCGHPPFRADTSYGILRRITDHPHRKLSQIQSATPVWMESIIDRLLQKDPTKRFDSAHELAKTLEDCLAHLRQPTVVQLPRIRRIANPYRHLFTALVVLLVIAAVTASVLQWAKISDVTEIPNESPTAASDEALPVSPDNHSSMIWQYDDTGLTQLEQALATLLNETQIPLNGK